MHNTSGDDNFLVSGADRSFSSVPRELAESLGNYIQNSANF